MANRVPRRLGKYEIREPLGHGGMAEVWQAFDTQLRRNVAIKVMHPNLATDPEFVTRFTREAQTVAALRHPNIVRIYDFHAGDQSERDLSEPGDGAVAYMVMEYIQGQTLAQYLRGASRADGLSAPAAIIRLFTPICLALDYAHQQSVIHRDIKPANILLDERNTARNPMGEPILSDFGLAKMLAGGTATITGSLIGTPLYMSPEQIQDKPLTDRSDLYSLGAVLYEVCAGAPPFDGDSVAGIILRHINEPPPAPDQLNPQLPSAVADVLVKSLAKDPSQRYPSASAFLAALAEAFGTSVPEEISAMAALRALSPHAAATIPAAREDSEATILPQGSPAASLTVPASGLAATEPAMPPSPPARTPPAPATPASETALSRISARMAAAPEAVRSLRGPRLALAIGLVCALLASGLGGFIYLTHRGAAAAVSPAVGQVYFVNSGQANAQASAGINDELQITLRDIPAPQQGKSYYAWLLPDLRQSEAPDVLLGKLSVQRGAINFLYPGDSQHTDLLAITSRFLITEETANVTPDIPTPDLSAWRYYAQLPQTPASGQKYSLLDHLRHLLAKDPDLEAAHLHGGLVIWAFRDTRQVNQWAVTARDDWNAQDYYGVRERAIAMLDYLDGSANVARDVPAGTPILADSHIAQVGLLEFDPAHQNPPGYLYHIDLHLNGVLQAPGATSAQRAEATKIAAGLSNVKLALTQARKDATSLASMSDSQLAQPATLSLINDLVSVTTSAYQGQTNSTPNQTAVGMSQIYPEIQQLAAFTVTAYAK